MVVGVEREQFHEDVPVAMPPPQRLEAVLGSCVEHALRDADPTDLKSGGGVDMTNAFTEMCAYSLPSLFSIFFLHLLYDFALFLMSLHIFMSLSHAPSLYLCQFTVCPFIFVSVHGRTEDAEMAFVRTCLC